MLISSTSHKIILIKLFTYNEFNKLSHSQPVYEKFLINTYVNLYHWSNYVIKSYEVSALLLFIMEVRNNKLFVVEGGGVVNGCWQSVAECRTQSIARDASISLSLSLTSCFHFCWHANSTPPNTYWLPYTPPTTAINTLLIIIILMSNKSRQCNSKEHTFSLSILTFMLFTDHGYFTRSPRAHTHIHTAHLILRLITKFHTCLTDLITNSFQPTWLTMIGTHNGWTLNQANTYRSVTAKPCIRTANKPYTNSR